MRSLLAVIILVIILPCVVASSLHINAIAGDTYIIPIKLEGDATIWAEGVPEGITVEFTEKLIFVNFSINLKPGTYSFIIHVEGGSPPNNHKTKTVTITAKPGHPIEPPESPETPPEEEPKDNESFTPYEIIDDWSDYEPEEEISPYFYILAIGIFTLLIIFLFLLKKRREE